MKKTVSTNIKGILFHIEEDGYKILRSYLDSVRKYFASYDDSQEIVEDIETRIAEKFNAKISGTKQVITAEDIESLIKTMGTVSDFKELDDHADKSESKMDASDETTVEEEQQSEKKKLFRVMNNRQLGGVATGIAHYLSIDVIWVRLVFILGLINFYVPVLDWFNFKIWNTSPFFLISYIILWVVLPEKQLKIGRGGPRKLFRSSKDKVIGGVAAGIAQYFAVDVMAVRLAFVVSIFFGMGIIAYVLLWIVTPKATSLTDEMQMQGQPVTLSNIELNLKKKLKIKDENGEESALAKVLLFPFRVISSVFEFLGQVAAPSSKVIFTFLKLILSVAIGTFGLALLVAAVAIVIIAMGDFSWEVLGEVFEYNLGRIIPAPVMLKVVPFGSYAIAAAFIGLLGTVFIITGINIANGRNLFKPYLGWGIGLSMIFFIVLGVITLPDYDTEFKAHNTYESLQPIPRTVSVFSSTGVGLTRAVFARNKVYLKNGEGDESKVRILVSSYGKDEQSALFNARGVNTGLKVSNDRLFIYPAVDLKKEAPYRGQEVAVQLYMAEGHVFRFDQEMAKLIPAETLFQYGIAPDDLSQYSWRFVDGALECLACDILTIKQKSFVSTDDAVNNMLPIENFDELEIDGDMEVILIQSEQPSIKIYSQDEEFNNISIDNFGSSLKVSNTSTFNWISFFKFAGSELDRPKVRIATPDLKKLSLNGNVYMQVELLETRDLQAHVHGSSHLTGKIYCKDMDLQVHGASKTVLKGASNYMSLQSHGASSIDMVNFEINNCNVEAHGASNIGLFVNDKLRVRSHGASSIRYKGNPATNIEHHGGSSVTPF